MGFLDTIKKFFSGEETPDQADAFPAESKADDAPAAGSKDGESQPSQ